MKVSQKCPWRHQERSVSHRASQNTLSMEGDGESPDTSPTEMPRCVGSSVQLPNSDKSKLAAVLKLHPYVCMSYIAFHPVVEGLSNIQLPMIHDTSSAAAVNCLSLSPNGA